MGKLLCKLFRFILNVFTRVVEFVAEAVKLIGTAAVDVLGDLFEAGGNAISKLFSGPGGVVLLGIGAYLLVNLLGKDDENSDSGARTKINTAREVIT